MNQMARFFSALLLFTFGFSTNAHLISAGNGLIDILTERAVLLISLPVSTFQNFNTNQDGHREPEEIRLNRQRIIAQLSQSIDFHIGETRGKVLDDQFMV